MEPPQHLRELCSINKLNRLAACELKRLVGVYAGRDENRTVSSLGGHHAEKLAHRFHPNLVGFPALTLNNRRSSIPVESNVHSAIGAATAHLVHAIPLLSVYLCYLPLEVLPSQPIQPVDVEVLLQKSRSLLTQVPSGGSGEKAHQGWDKTNQPAEHLHLWGFVVQP